MNSPITIIIILFLLSSCDYKISNINNSVVNTDISLDIINLFEKAKENRTKPSVGITYIDSALVFSKVNKNDSLYLKCLAYKSFLLSKKQNYNKAISYSDSLLQYALKFRDTNYIAKAFFKKGLYNIKLDYTVKAFKNYILSKKKYEALKDSNQVAGILLNISIIQKDIGDYSAAKASVVEGLKFQSNASTKKHASKLYNLLSIVKKEEKNYPKSLEYTDKAIQLFTEDKTVLKAKDSLRLITFLNGKAVSFIKKKDFGSALNLLNKLNTSELINAKTNKKYKALVLDNLGVVKGKLNNKEAERDLLLAYAIRDSIGYKKALNASYIHLCEYYRSENKLEKASSWAKLAFKNAVAFKSLIAQKEALHYITDLEKSPEQKHIKAYKKVTDSLTLLSNQVRAIYAEEKYQAQRYKLKVLKTEQEVSAVEFQRKLILIIACTIVLLGFFYYHYSNKIKTEKNKQQQLVTAYQTETEISKRVHDELANDVYGVITKLQANNNSYSTDHKNDVIDQLELIYNKSRDISRETNTVETKNFTSALNDMLSLYNTEAVNVICKGLEPHLWETITASKKIVVFRVLQELMINMAKHSKASFVLLNFTKTASKVEIKYSDNGVGINKNKSYLKNGLQNAETRMESINGVFTFETKSNEGFKANIRF